MEYTHDNYTLKINIFEIKDNINAISSIYFHILFNSNFYSDNVYLKIRRDYRNFKNSDNNNKLIILPVYAIGEKNDEYCYGDLIDACENNLHLTTKKNKHSIKREHVELNRTLINAKNWMFPLIEFRELYFSHQEKDNGLFNIFHPMEVQERWLLTIPIRIKKNYLNKLQRFKLHEEISKFLDMVCLIICIIYSLSNIKYNYIKSIEQQLFKPWNLKVSQKFKECGDMIRLPFIDIEDIDDIMYLSVAVLKTYHAYEYVETDADIFIESINMFMKEIYKKHEKVERRVNNFIQIHEGIPIAILTLLTVIIGLIQIK
jgi:hypothetical protein